MLTTGTSSSAMGNSSSKAASFAETASAFSGTNTEQDQQVLQSVHDLRSLCKQFHRKCHNAPCGRVLPIDNHADHIEAWAAGARTIPPTTHLSAFTCPCSTRTCVGCNFVPTLSAFNLFTPLGVINHCCDQGRLYAIYFLLCRFDDSQLQPEKEPQPKPKPKKKVPPTKGGHNDKHASSSSGVGYASNYESLYASSNWGGMSLDEIDDMELDLHNELAMAQQYSYSAVVRKLSCP